MHIKKIISLFIIICLSLGIVSANSALAGEVAIEMESPLNLESLDNSVLVVPQPIIYSPYELKKGEIVFNEASRKINAVNPTAFSNKSGSFFPGARGANQLVIYTSSYGVRTGTNEFGTEAIVDGNTVTELSGADSIVPQNGAIISGHGVAKNWITENVKVGTKVYIDNSTNTLNVYTTSESFLFEAAKKIDEAKTMVDYYKSKNSNYDGKVPNQHIKEAQDYLKKAERDTDNVKKYSQLAIESANNALKSILPYVNTEFKGVWVRPTETTEEEIEASVQRIKKAGIDNIFIETYFHGRTIFPSKTMASYGFIKQNEKFQGLDPLKLWIKYAHKNNMKVHIWFETFYVGNQRPETNPENILAVRPEWANKIKKNANLNVPTPSVSEHNGFFIDPANPDVQDFLQKLITEIITTYKPDGINLDYIRYPQAVSINDINAWGFTEAARNEFKAIYQKDPMDITINDPLWIKWCEYRREKVTNFVSKIGALGRENNVYISAVIFPDRLSALNTKQQDWKTWSTRGYVNGFTPLFLTCNAQTLNALATSVINVKSPNTDLFAGLFVTFMGGSEEDLIREIHETRKIDVKGVILFDYAHLDNRYINALSTRVFSPAQEGGVVLRRVDGSAQSAQSAQNAKSKKSIEKSKKEKHKEKRAKKEEKAK